MLDILSKLDLYEEKMEKIKRIYYSVDFEQQEENLWKSYLLKELYGIRRCLDFSRSFPLENNNIGLEISNLEALINRYRISFKKFHEESINEPTYQGIQIIEGLYTTTTHKDEKDNTLLTLLAIYYKLINAQVDSSLISQLIHDAFFKLKASDNFICESINLCISKDELTELINEVKEHPSICENLISTFPFGAFTKSVYNKFFSKDLYGKYDNEKDNIILSSGSLSESEFPLSFTLKNCIDYAVSQDFVGYSHSLGLEQTRDAIAFMENLFLSKGEYNNSNVAVTMGGQAGINLINEYFKNRDVQRNEVIMLIPNYAPFMHLFEKNYNVKYISYMKDTDNLCDKIKNLTTSRTKLVVLVDVTNPTGVKIGKTDLEEIIDFTKERNIYLLIDEAGKCYLDQKYDSPHNFSENNVIRVRSLSKSHGIPGLKIGYILASEEIINNLYGLISASYGAPNAIFYTLLEFVCRFEGYRYKNIYHLTEAELRNFNANYGLTLRAVNIMYKEYLHNQEQYENKVMYLRKYTISRLNPYVGTLIDEIIYPEGSLNICIKVNSKLKSYDFFLELLKTKKVAVFPGICFGIYEGCWIRITYTVSKSDLEKGLTKLLEFLKEEHMLTHISQDSGLNELLVVRGKYTYDSDVNFLSHLYNVGLTMNILLRNLPAEKYTLFNQAILNKLVLIHDAGKVLSVYVNRYSRIARYRDGDFTEKTMAELENFNDKELLYTKNLLKIKTGKSQINIPSFLTEYSKLIEIGKNHNIKDTFITNKLLGSFLRMYQGEDIQLIKSIKMYLDNNVDDIHLKLLDLSDKLSDYYPLLKGIDIHNEIINALDEKKDYVKWRYGRDGAGEDSIERDFNKAKIFSTEIFGFNQSEVLTI